MVDLCELAGEDPRAGLCDLNLWRSESTDVRLAYEKIRMALAAAAAIAIMVGGLAVPASAAALDRAPERASERASATAYDILWEIVAHAIVPAVKRLLTLTYRPFLIRA